MDTKSAAALSTGVSAHGGGELRRRQAQESLRVADAPSQSPEIELEKSKKQVCHVGGSVRAGPAVDAGSKGG